MSSRSPELEDKLKDATTLYVGNLYVIHPIAGDEADGSHRSFYTTEEQIHELFSK
jgi:nuclear cap-binding protein subunit 2